MEPQKFEIEGEIEAGEVPKKRGIAGRFFLFVLVVAVVGAVLYFPYLQDSFPGLKKITGIDPEGETGSKFSKTSFDSLQRVNDSLVAANTLLLENSPDNTGLYYEVQIGAFKNFDLEKYRENLADLRGETEEGYNKLTLGKFRDLKMAKEFLKDIREIGFNDAWIVAKENGQRVPLDNNGLTE